MKKLKFNLLLILSVAMFAVPTILLSKQDVKTVSEKLSTEQLNNLDNKTLIDTVKTISMVKIKDTVKTVNFKTLSLNEDNLKMVMDSIGIHHQDIVIKQARLETGNYRSSLCRCYGNLFGMRTNSGYYKYSHWTESVIDYRNKIQKKYRSGENYYYFLKRIKYCPDRNYTKLLAKM